MNAPTIVDIYAAQVSTGIKPVVIRKRLSRGALTHHGYDRKGRALIDLNELAPRARAVAA